MFDALTVPIGDDSTRTHLGPAEGLARLLYTPIELITVQSPGSETAASRLQLDDARAELDVPTKPPVVLESNDVARAITEHLSAHRKRLLCMATHGRSALGAAVLGSIASDVLRLVHDPLVLIGPAARPPVGTEILVAVQPDDPQALAAVDAAAQLVRMVAGMSLHLVSIGAEGSPPALAALPNATFEVIGDGAPAEQLVWLVADRKPAILVVGTHARTGLGRLLLGSVAERVVRDASVPVLVVPPAAPQ